MIVFSTTMYFALKSYEDYCTGQFLKESENLLNILEIECMSGNAYPAIFASVDMRNFKYYREFDFLNRENFVQKISKERFIDSRRIQRCMSFVLQLGQRDSENEIKFLSYCKKRVGSMANSYREKFKKNRQTNILYGLCGGIMIFIMLV